MDDKEFFEKTQKLILKSSEYRGRIIDATIQLETIIDSTIVNYFCDNETKKNELLKLLIATEYTKFITKVNLLKFIITSIYQDKYSVLLEDIDKIRILRNNLAHSRFLTTRESIEVFDGTTITLTYFKNNKRIDKQFTLDDMNKYITKINNSSQTILNLFHRQNESY